MAELIVPITAGKGVSTKPGEPVVLIRKADGGIKAITAKAALGDIDGNSSLEAIIDAGAPCIAHTGEGGIVVLTGPDAASYRAKPVATANDTQGAKVARSLPTAAGAKG